ncbi:MAG: SH3 domain-containing protein [Chloroflexota bacterium]
MKIRMLFVFLMLFVLVACNGEDEADEAPPTAVPQQLDPLPTDVPIEVPTIAPTPTSLPTLPPEPTETAVPIEEPTAAPVEETSEEGDAGETADATSEQTLELRDGPGEEFEVVGATEPGQDFAVLGQDQSGQWFNVQLPSGQTGWLYGEALTFNTPLENIGITLTIPAIPGAPTLPALPTLPAELPTIPAIPTISTP